MFALQSSDYQHGVLDCGGGPASFATECHDDDIRVVAIDPLYQFLPAQIRDRFESSVDSIMAQVHADPNAWTWTFHRDPDELLANRRTALERFLADFAAGIAQGRYITASLPRLPFDDDCFGLALCSHLLFLYSQHLDEAFHVAATLELCRVAKEVRIFPLVTLDGERSPHLDSVRSALERAGFQSRVVGVEYELQRGGNQMLQIRRA